MEGNQQLRLSNYHSHTVRCNHATGTEEAYVLQALESGFTELGFADHSPWPYKGDFVSRIRMRIGELEDYVRTVEALRDKYADKLRIRLGLECEAFPEFYPWLRELLSRGQIEYLLLGNHYDTNDSYGMYFGHCERARELYRYMETTIAGMQSGLFRCLAHPDLFLYSYSRFDADAKRVSRAVCEAAKQLDIPLEYNLLGARRNLHDRAMGHLGYSCREFWEIAAETGNRAIVGADAHRPSDLDCVGAYHNAWSMLRAMGIQLTDSLF